MNTLKIAIGLIEGQKKSELGRNEFCDQRIFRLAPD